MSKTHIVIPDIHATPGRSNKKAEWIGRLINEVRPDVVVNLGDTADMSSLCTYDRGKRSFVGRTYRADVDAAIDFEDRMWSTVRSAKKRMPLRIILTGNHEQRIERAIDVQPELEGVISYSDLDREKYYDIVVPYSGSTPGTLDVDGITYAHYVVSGVSGRAISGEHLAYSLLAKKHCSVTVGHNHTLDYCIRSTSNGRKIMGLCAGTMQDYDPSYAGEATKLWWRGVIIKRRVENGAYDPEFVSLDRLKKEYSSVR